MGPKLGRSNRLFGTPGLGEKHLHTARRVAAPSATQDGSLRPRRGDNKSKVAADEGIAQGATPAVAAVNTRDQPGRPTAA